MSKLNPHIRFNDGKCREAVSFYKECLGGETSFMTVSDSPMAAEMPGKENLIMHATLEKDGEILLSASDMMRDKMVVGDNIAIMLTCQSEEEATTLFSNFAKEGKVFMPLEVQFWGGLFGIVIDKFEVEWTVNYQKK